MARPFNSFKPHYSDYILEFDASLNGMGFILYKKENNIEIIICACSINTDRYNFGIESRYQNTSEYISAVLEIILSTKYLRDNGIHLSSIALRGDSKVALAWMDNESTKGSFATRAIALLALTSARKEIFISETIHIFTNENNLADKLSRNYSVNSIFNNKVIDIMSYTGMMENKEKILTFCDPMIGRKNEEENFDSFWKSIIPFIDSL